jgi:hypothetical protein
LFEQRLNDVLRKVNEPNEPLVRVQYDERGADGVGARLGRQVLVVDFVSGLEDFLMTKNGEK